MDLNGLCMTVDAPCEEVPEEIAKFGPGYNDWNRWKRMAPDAMLVDIGYHHCRVDYLLRHDVTVTGYDEHNKGILTILAGVVVAFQPTQGTIELLAGEYGCIRSKGHRVSGPICRFTSDKAVSMRVESPWWPNPLSGRVRIGTDSWPGSPDTGDGSYILDTRFSWSVALDVEVALYRSPGFSPVCGNEFGYSAYGLRCTASNTLTNNVFVGNLQGLTAWNGTSGGELDGTLTLANCTFPDNSDGIVVGTASGAQAELAVGDCVFTDSESKAISVKDNDCALDEHHNAFFKPGAGENDHIYYVGTQLPINVAGGSLNLADPPYDEDAEHSRRFLLAQDCPAVDAGSQSSADGGMDVETTSFLGALDTGCVDMGYHYRVSPPLTTPGPENVLVVWNENDPDSREIKIYYCSAETGRGIPASNRLPIYLPEGVAYRDPSDPPGIDEKKNITLSDYREHIQSKVATWFSQNPDNDIRFIVLCKGLPYRIEIMLGGDEQYLSITARLPLWPYDTADAHWTYDQNEGYVNSFTDYREDAGQFLGGGANRRFGPYTYAVWNDVDRKAVPLPCLVTMLNGYSVTDVKRMIYKSVGSRPSRHSVYWVLDEIEVRKQPGCWPPEVGKSNFLEVGVYGSHVLVEGTNYNVQSSDIYDNSVMGYSAWASGHRADSWRRDGMDFRAAYGAIETVVESWDGRGFMEGTQTWGQGLTADAFHPNANQGTVHSRSLSGGCCHSDEPGMMGVVNPTVMFPRYFQGYTFAEAAFMESGVQKEHVLHIGDPLMTIE